MTSTNSSAANPAKGVAPQQPNNNLLRTLLGGGLGVGASLLLSFIGRSRDAKTSSGSQTDIAQTPTVVKPGVTPVNNFGGASDVLLPQITGVSNQPNQYGRIPRCYGYVRVYPALSIQPYSYIQGNDQFTTVAYDFGYGPLAISDIRISDNPISQYTSVSYQIQSGAAGDAAFNITQYNTGEASFDDELTYLVGVTHNQTASGKYIVVDLYFPNGLYKKVSITDKNGYTTEIQQPATISVNVNYYGASGTSGHQEILITENSATPFRHTYQIPAPVVDTYSVQLVRNTLVDTSGNTVDAVHWDRLASRMDGSPWGNLIDANGNPILFARLALLAQATNEFNGTIGQVSAYVQSLLRQWTGSAWTVPTITNNPAWIALDILQGPHNAKPVPDSQIDLASFKAWADFCTANNITFNAVYDSETTPFQALKDVFAVGRAKLIQPNGNILAVMIDQPRTTVVQHFTPRNSWGFQWKAVRSATPDLLKVQWVNPAIGWQQDERLVYNEGKDANSMRTFESVQLKGCTDASQAYKYGKFFLASDQSRRRYYQLYADHETIVCTQGDLIRITNPIIGAGSGQGRIKAITTDGSGNITALTLDSRVQMLTGQSYQIRIRLSTGATMVAAVTTNPGNQSLLTLTTPIPAATAVKPQLQDLVMFGSGQDSIEAIITNIEWTPQLTAFITAVDHAPGIYTADTTPVPPFTSLIQMRHPVQVTVDPPVILSVQSDESVLTRDSDGALRTAIVLTLQPLPANVQYLETSYKRSDSNIWTPAQLAPNNGGPISIFGVQDGVTYDIRVRARRFDSWVSDWNSSITNYFCVGKTTPPPDIQVLEVDPLTGNPRWYYDAQHGINVPIDFAGFRVKMHWGYNLDWNTATIVSQLQTGTSVDVSKFARGLKTFLVKAVDVSGFESENPAILVRDFGAYIPQNIVASFDYSGTFPGAFSGCILSLGKLVQLSASHYWQSDTNKFWTGINSHVYWTSLFQEMTYQFSYTPDRTAVIKPFTIKLQLDIDSPAYKVEYQADGNSLFWSGGPTGGNNSFWTGNANQFWTQDQVWHPMPETGLEGNYGTYRFKITCFAGKYQSKINSVKVIADVPDIIKRYTLDIPTAAGARIPITPGDFRAIVYVNPALILNGAHPSANTPEVADMALSGPLIKMRDPSGAYTSGTVSVEVGGY